MKTNNKGTKVSGDPYGIQDSKKKTANREDRIKAVEDALLEAVEEIKVIRNKIEKIETSLPIASKNLVG